MNNSNPVKDILFGVAVADALGVPVEFKSREQIAKNPVTDMIGYGTYNLPPGTWSDDSSLALCLADALMLDFSLDKIAQNFVDWRYHNFWTPRGYVFDIGIATQEAIINLTKGTRPELAGGWAVHSNGNGSLMRIAPLLFYIKDKSMEERYEITNKVSSITHGHVRSVIACFYYLEFARLLLAKKDKFQIYEELKSSVTDFLVQREIKLTEIALFDRLLQRDIHKLKVGAIDSSGYVLHTLEASIWCLLTTDNYKDATLKAVNLGEDTDTTAAVTGGLAGLLYGHENIPAHWMEQLAKRENIEKLAEQLSEKYFPVNQ